MKSEEGINAVNELVADKDGTGAEYRVEQLSKALRSVCEGFVRERGCYEGECGTYACCYDDCPVDPALKLLESLEREALTNV